MKIFFKRLVTLAFLLLIILFIPSCSNQNTSYKFFNKKIIKIALVLSGPVNDSSWSAAAYNGLKRFQSDYKSDIAVVEKVSLYESKDIFSSLAEKKYDFVIALGYKYGFILKKIARMYPETFFCVVGGEVARTPNLCSFGFRDEQYGYLLGVVAGFNTATNKVGIVVGGKLPSIERTIAGMRKGLRAVNPKADLVVSYIDSWDDIAKGRDAALEEINTGVDVITHLADASGIGVIKAAEESDISAIGAITDQHDLAPTTIVTSGIEDASQLVYIACEHYLGKILEPKIYHFGLKHQVVDIAPSYGNIDPTTETKINRIKSELTDLEIEQTENLEKIKK